MNYSGISECDVLNGTGFRVVLFVSGCSHKCYNCQNPKTWNENFGHPFTEKTKEYLFECLSKDYIDGITITGGDPLYEKNLDEVLNLIKEIREKYPILQNVDLENPYKSRVSEPQNDNEIRLSFPEKTIWLYTGFKWESLMTKIHQPTFPDSNFEHFIQINKKRQEIIKLCNVVVDGEYIDEQRDITLKWRGSKNQRVIDVKQSLAQNKVVLYCD